MHTSSSSAQGEYSSTSRYGQPSSYGSARMEPSVSMTDDLEPSDEWKQRLKGKIEQERLAMEADANRQLEEDIRSVPHQRDTILREHTKALQNIRVLAEDKYRTQLEQERQDRKWAAQISMDGNGISDALRAEQEAILAKFKQESGGDSSQSGRQDQPPGSAGISPPARSDSRPQALPIFPDRPPLPPDMAPPPTASPSKPEVWVPKSSASASSSRPPQAQRKDPPPPRNQERPDRGAHPPGGFSRPSSEYDAPGLSKSPPPSSARLSPWSGEGMGPRGGFGGGGTSPRPIERPPTTSPFADHPPYQSHHPPPPSMASSPPGTSPSPQLWQPAISPEDDITSPTSTTPSYASTLGLGQGVGGPGSATSTSSSTSRPFSSIGRRGSSASIRSVASTASTRSMASVTSMTSMRSSVSGKGRMGVDDAILEREESGSEGGYDEDDDHEYGQRRGAEAEGGEEQMRNRIAENMRRMQEEQQRQRGVEMAWQRPMGGSGEVGMDGGSSRPKRGKTLSSIPVLPLGPSSSSESKKSGKSKAKSKPLSASATVPQYDAGYMRSGKEWDGSREWEREELGQSKTMRNAMSPSASRPPSSSTRPITIQPTLIDEDFNPPYSQSHSPYPPLSSSASSSKRSKSISRKASSNFTEPPAIYGPEDVPPTRGGRRFSNEQHSQMYGAGDELDGPPHGFEYGSHRRNTSGPSVLPTPPPSTSNTRSNSLRYPPPNRTFSGGVPYTPEPEGYEEGPTGVMDGYERNRLSRDAGMEMDEEWEPENPRRRLSSSASSGTKWNNPGSIRRTPGKPVPQPLNPGMFDRDNEESANIHYHERTMPPYPNDGSQSAYPQTWVPPRSGRPTGGPDSSPQKPPYSADPYERPSVSKRGQQSLREQEERGEPIRPQRTTSMRSNGRAAPGVPPPDWFTSPRQPNEIPPSRRPSQRSRGSNPFGAPQYRRPGNSDDEESSDDAEEGYGGHPEYAEHDADGPEAPQYSRDQWNGVDGRRPPGHAPLGPGGIRGRHQHRYRQASQRKQQRVRIAGDEPEQTESEEQSQEDDSEEGSEGGGYGEETPHRRNAGDESDFFPPVRSMGRATPFHPGQYDAPAPSLMTRAPSGGPGYPKQRGDGWDAVPPPQFREMGTRPRKQKKQKKRWMDPGAEDEEDRDLVDRREAEERAEAEHRERERLEAERIEKERVEAERKEMEERERKEKEEREERERELREKRERDEREKREYMERREREEREQREKEECEKREREEREREWERERQAKREAEQKREFERERRREREREKERERERKAREVREKEQRLKEEEIEKRLGDLKSYAAEAEEKMRLAQELVDKNKLAEERAEEYERKNEEATKLAEVAAEKWKGAERRYNEARLLVQMAKQRAAEASKKELEILQKEKELREREAQLRRFEDELKRREEEREFEERKRIVEEEKRRLEEEAKEEAKEEEHELEQNQLEKTRLEEIVAEQARQLEELKRERDEEKAKNATDDSYGLAEIFGLEDIPEEDPATIAMEDEGNCGKRPKGKKEKKVKGKRAREEKERRDAYEEEERLARERKEREEQEATQRLEEEQRAREEQEAREREDQERRAEDREKRKRKKEKRKSKDQRTQGSAQEKRHSLTPEELEEQEERALAAEERRKQEEQQAEQERQAKERERIEHQKEVERMKRAREAMDAEERFRREQETKHREEEERLERKRLEDEERRREEESRGAQQAGYRKMDEELRRKRQDSGGGIDSAWSSFTGASRSPPPARNFTTPFPDRSPPAWASWGTTPTPPTPSSAWSTNMAGNTTTAGFPPRPSTTIPNKPRSGSMGSNVPPDPQEWERKQAEFVRQQEEKFKKEQERAQRAAWASRAQGGRASTKEELVRLFEDNERVWSSLPSMTALRWSDFPWPMIRRPSNPEDITTAAIEGYVLSQFYPDKSKADKDRVKEYIRRWHPDRFETKLLNKVVEEEKERVREGAGSVARSLNDILAKMNDS